MELHVKVVGGYEEKDRKYRTLILLQRSDRPRYWTWHCPNCQQPIVELNNTDMYAMTDFYNPAAASNAAVSIRCPGLNCKRWYAFQLK